MNGNSGSGPDKAEPVDPKLRDFGSNPAREALSVLVVVARHLAAIQGHKNLVWVSSDNVLADWTDKAVSSDKGSKHIEGFVLRTQEAMNDAHVSVYPLDASQLETQAIDPSLKNRNIQLAPGVSAHLLPRRGGAQDGRITAEMIQDLHPIQAPIQEMAQATGGRAIPRAGDMVTALNRVVEDGRATYLISFSPDAAGRRSVPFADGKAPRTARSYATLPNRLPVLQGAGYTQGPFAPGDMAVVRRDRNRRERASGARVHGDDAQTQHRNQRLGTKAAGRSLDR